MKCMKKLAVLMALVLCATAAFAAKPLEGEHYKVAVCPTFPPFEFEELDDKGNNKIVGFEIDFIDKLAENLGFTYETIHTNFKGLLGELSSGRANMIIAALSPTEERKKTFDFTVPYYYSRTTIIQHKGANIKHVADLKGKKITASFGTNYCDFAAAMGAEVLAMESSVYCLQELLAGRADGMVQDIGSASYRCKLYPELEYHVLPQEELLAAQGEDIFSSFAGVFPKGSPLVPLFSAEIEKFMKDGTMKAIYEKWIGEWPY